MNRRGFFVPKLNKKENNIMQLGLFDDSQKYKNGLDVMVDTLYNGLKEKILLGELDKVYLMRNIAAYLCDDPEFNPVLKTTQWKNRFEVDEYVKNFDKLNTEQFYSLLNELKPRIIHSHTLPNEQLYNALKDYKYKNDGKIIFTPHSVVIYDIISDLVMQNFSDPFIKKIKTLVNEKNMRILDALVDVNYESYGSIQKNIRNFIKDIENTTGIKYLFLKPQEDMFKLSDKIIAVSDFEKQTIEFFYPEYAYKLVVIENASDFTDLLNNPESILRISEGTKELEKKLGFKRYKDVAFSYIGRFSDEKGIGTLINAMKLHLPKYKNSRFYFIVPSSQHEYAYTTLKNHLRGYESRYLLVPGDNPKAISSLLKTDKFLDYTDREMIATWINFSDYVVVPSMRESFGLTALESALMGTPLIISETDALVDVHKDYAIRYAPADDETMLAKVLDLVTQEHPQMYFDLSKRIVKTINEKNYFEKYSPENFVNQHMKLYSKYLK